MLLLFQLASRFESRHVGPDPGPRLRSFRTSAGLSWGIYFFAYNRAKERYQRLLQQSKLSPQLHLLSAAEAGSLVSQCRAATVQLP